MLCIYIVNIKSIDYVLNINNTQGIDYLDCVLTQLGSRIHENNWYFNSLIGEFFKNIKYRIQLFHMYI